MGPTIGSLRFNNGESVLQQTESLNEPNHYNASQQELVALQLTETCRRLVVCHFLPWIAASRRPIHGRRGKRRRTPLGLLPPHFESSLLYRPNNCFNRKPHETLENAPLFPHAIEAPSFGSRMPHPGVPGCKTAPAFASMYLSPLRR